MPTTYSKAHQSVFDMASDLLMEFETHKPTLDADVKIDLVFAFGARNDDGELIGDAIKKNGVKGLGSCRVLSLKDRSKGLGDVEICLDGDWWEAAGNDERRAVLDHELHHIKTTGRVDDLGRPVVKMRKHDVDVGWFSIIAARHGQHSVERSQAKMIFDLHGQSFFPWLEDKESVRMSIIEPQQQVKVTKS